MKRSKRSHKRSTKPETRRSVVFRKQTKPLLLNVKQAADGWRLGLKPGGYLVEVVLAGFRKLRLQSVSEHLGCETQPVTATHRTT